MALLGDLEVIVIEADQAEGERHPEYDPDVRVEWIGPKHRGDDEARQDHQPAHSRRAALGDEMRLRAVVADRLALALAYPEHVDERAAEQEHEHQRGDDGAAGAKGDVTENVEQRDLVG